MSTKLALCVLPLGVLASEPSTYYYSTWSLLAVSLLFYSCLVATTTPYARERTHITIGPLFLLILFPPAFFVLLVYLLYLRCFVAVVTHELPVVSVQARRTISTRRG